jgi:zinc transport system ATP-binding protein
MDREAVVSLHDVDYAYGEHPALRDVQLEIAAGDFVSIIGPNGGGKTTLLRLILGLLEPDHGTVRVFGRPPVQTRQRIGYMPQFALLDEQFPVTVADIVLMGRLSRRTPLGPFRSSDRDIARRALAEVEMTDLENQPFSALSGGQRQRVLIARALACRPELLLLDEPTASLDPGIQDELYELLHQLKERMTVVLVSHDVGVVSQHVDRIICVNVHVAQHPSSAIKGELAKLFPSRGGMRLVHHDHDTSRK